MKAMHTHMEIEENSQPLSSKLKPKQKENIGMALSFKLLETHKTLREVVNSSNLDVTC